MSSPSEFALQRRIEAEPDFQTRLMAPAVRVHENVVVGADVSDVVIRILLFNNYILDSTRLLEIPQLVSAFGADGLIELLQRGILQIRCEPLVVGQIGQTTILREENGFVTAVLLRVQVCESCPIRRLHPPVPAAVTHDTGAQAQNYSPIEKSDRL